MTYSNNPTAPDVLRLKFIKSEQEKVEQAQLEARRSNNYIFTPKNDLEAAAIILATKNENGWKGSLYSLEYFDRYLDQTCFIFATKPVESKHQQWLLLSFNHRTTAKYWIVLGEKSLAEVYYAWAGVAKKPDPSFNPEQMAKDIPWDKLFPGQSFF
jgi:hypothetical protein